MERIIPKLTRLFVVAMLCAAAVTTASSQEPNRTIDYDALAARGQVLVNEDPLAVELRNQQANESGRRAFDIGMGVADGNTAPGPGKDRVCALQLRGEARACSVAVLFSVERNRNAELAATGARIARSNERISAARNAETDVFFKLGFDIASGIFGDRALGAAGNTLMGPGSQKIRDSLSTGGQRGFNASVKFHLGQAASDGESVSDRGGAVRVNDNPGGVGRVIDKSGPGAVIDKENSRLPNTSKRLIITAEGTSLIQPVPSGKINLHQESVGEIYFAISYEDGTPFPLAKSADIKISMLAARPSGNASESVILSEVGDGVWHVRLPRIDSASRIYLISVVTEAKAWHTTFQGRSMVRVDYTRLPYWNAQRYDGTIWDPPK